MSQLITFFIAAAPIFELRAAIPLATGVFGLSPFEAFYYSVLGNLLPVIFLAAFLPKISEYLIENSSLMKEKLEKLYSKTQKKHSRSIENLGSLGLFVLTALPMPFTGAWTAALVAFLFKLPFRKSFFAIALGVITAGLLVSAVTQGIIFAL